MWLWQWQMSRGTEETFVGQVLRNMASTALKSKLRQSRSDETGYTHSCAQDRECGFTITGTGKVVKLGIVILNVQPPLWKKTWLMSTLYAILYTTYTICFKLMLLAFVMFTLVEAKIKLINSIHISCHQDDSSYFSDTASFGLLKFKIFFLWNLIF